MIFILFRMIKYLIRIHYFFDEVGLKKDFI